jgi:hypothetical protein
MKNATTATAVQTVTTMQNPNMVKASELRLGDVVSTFTVVEGYDSATVVEVDHDNEVVKLVRPYIHTSDFSHAGASGAPAVMPYVGLEHFEVRFCVEVAMLHRNRTAVR